LWFTVRTFDGRFDRIPDRPGRAPVLADVVVVLAALIGIGGLIGGIAAWIQGTRDFMPAVDNGVSACILLVAVGFVLLAIGPALVALALATAPMAFRVATTVKPLPGGGSVRIEANPWGDTYVTTTDSTGRMTARNETDAGIAEAGPAPPTQTRGVLLQIAALATATVLFHGAVFVSLGAALGVWIRRRGWAIAASVGLVLFVSLGLTIVYLLIFGDPGYPRWGVALASVLPVYSGLLFHRDRPTVFEDTSAPVAYCDVILILSAVVISWLAIRTVGRRSRGGPPAVADAEQASL